MTISTWIFVLIVVLALALGVAVGAGVASSRSAQRTRESASRAAELSEQVIALTARAERLEEENNGFIERSQAEGSVLQALSPIVKQLDEVSTHVTNLRTTQASQHAQVTTQLERDAKIGAELSQSTASINAALRSTSARGSWGEVQLRRVIEAAGMLEHVDFDAQLATSNFSRENGSASRPDVTIHLPGDTHIAIDAKVPMDAYLKATAIAPDDLASARERAELMSSHAKSVKGHVKALIQRNYPGDFPDSPQITVMFLPSESLLAQATDSDPTLLEYALSNGVVLASPSSLLALLRSIASVWTSAAASSEAREIVNLGRTLVDRIGTVVSHLDKLGKSLGQSVNHYNSAVQSLESRLLVTARQFSSVGVAGDKIAEPPAQVAEEKSQVRQFRAPEFTEKLTGSEADASEPAEKK